MSTNKIDNDAKILVIESGVVGAAPADKLSQAGHTQVIVVDQIPLFITGGSSSHAPGFALQFTNSRVKPKLTNRTLDELDGNDVNGQCVSKRVGGLELDSDEEYERYTQRRFELEQSWGIEVEVISAECCAEYFPGLDPASVRCGLNALTDATVRPVRAVEWQARRAIANGAVFYEHTKITGFRIEDDRIIGVSIECTPEMDSHPNAGSALDSKVTFLDADLVIIAGGPWGPALADTLRNVLSMVPMEHCSAWTLSILSTTVYYLHLFEKGAVFDQFDGSQILLWYAVKATPESTFARSSRAEFRLGEEARAALQAVALMDSRYFTAYRVSGTSAGEVPSGMSVSQIPDLVGQAAETGLVVGGLATVAVVTVVQDGADSFPVLGHAPNERICLRWDAENSEEVSAADLNSGLAAVTLVGPRAGRLLTGITHGHPNLHAGSFHERLDVADAPARLIPESGLGVPAWPLLIGPEHGLYLWDALLTAGRGFGITAAGGCARKALCIAAVQPAFRVDFGQWTVRETSGECIACLLNGDKSRDLVRLQIDDTAGGTLYGQTVVEVIGTVIDSVTSAARSPFDTHTLAYAWLDVEDAAPERRRSLREVSGCNLAHIGPSGHHRVGARELEARTESGDLRGMASRAPPVLNKLTDTGTLPKSA